MIDVRCRTKLDDYQSCEWPVVMAAVPRIGDYVESTNGKILKVCRITHSLVYWNDNHGVDVRPIIKIELTKGN